MRGYHRQCGKNVSRGIIGKNAVAPVAGKKLLNSNDKARHGSAGEHIRSDIKRHESRINGERSRRERLAGKNRAQKKTDKNIEKTLIQQKTAHAQVEERRLQTGENQRGRRDGQKNQRIEKRLSQNRIGHETRVRIRGNSIRNPVVSPLGSNALTERVQTGTGNAEHGGKQGNHARVSRNDNAKLFDEKQEKRHGKENREKHETPVAQSIFNLQNNREHHLPPSRNEIRLKISPARLALLKRAGSDMPAFAAKSAQRLSETTTESESA